MNLFTQSPETLTHSQVLELRDVAWNQFRFARTYTLTLLDDIPAELWPIIPTNGHSHIAWQVGHLAVAHYGLMLFRQRGRAPGDLDLMPSWLRKQYGRGSQPNPDTASVPTKEQLLARLHAIDTATQTEVPQLPADQLLLAEDMPYAVYPNKLGALLFCPLHESIHAGQIGLLRRQLGLSSIR